MREDVTQYVCAESCTKLGNRTEEALRCPGLRDLGSGRALAVTSARFWSLVLGWDAVLIFPPLRAAWRDGNHQRDFLAATLPTQLIALSSFLLSCWHCSFSHLRSSHLFLNLEQRMGKVEESNGGNAVSTGMQ